MSNTNKAVAATTTVENTTSTPTPTTVMPTAITTSTPSASASHSGNPARNHRSPSSKVYISPFIQLSR